MRITRIFERSENMTDLQFTRKCTYENCKAAAKNIFDEITNYKQKEKDRKEYLEWEKENQMLLGFQPEKELPEFMD